jgi:hypothetical protein
MNRVKVGCLTPPQQTVRLTEADVASTGPPALASAATGHGEVLVSTEHGPWVFEVKEAQDFSL